MATFQIWGDFPVEELRLKVSSSSHLCLTLRNFAGISSGPVEDGLIKFLPSQGYTATFPHKQCKKRNPFLEISISRNFTIHVSSKQYAVYNIFVPFPSEVWP